jgi:DNA-binding MarR family transcriptional regulator
LSLIRSWSSIIGKIEKPAFLTIDWILSQFGRNLPGSRGAYKAYVLRDEMIYTIYYDTDLTQKEIAEYLGLHYGSVSRIIRSFEKKK